MAVFKCKMCGGSLEVNSKESIAVCEYCGTKQTLPKLDDDKRANLYDRANHFRRGNEFDKAMGIYEQILNEDRTDAEAYWSLVLCKYGIEYVEDPSCHKRIPTVNRAQYVSIFLDENYQAALKYADGSQRHIYEQEAKAIEAIQKGILDISSKEKPFDVFICYKETDARGMRTTDSVIAQDIYYQLTEKGYNVFFSRITLESKIGQQYEPYIFAALNSAKVMVIVGTKSEYYNAVWVKNEWSRFVKIVQEKKERLIIPAYRDMDPYDLPDALSYYQALDMSKIGFIQDLIRGIEKVLGKEQAKINSDNSGAVETNTNLAALLKRGQMAVEDGEWDKAYEFFDHVLDMDPECADAYWGQALATNRVYGARDFVLKLISATEGQISQMPENKICIEQTQYEEMLARVKENSLDVDVTCLLEPITFCSEEEKWKIVGEMAKENINKDKLLSKFSRFSADNKKVEKMLELVEKEIDERIHEAKLTDVENRKMAENVLQEKISAMNETIDETIKIKGREYYRLRQMYSGNTGVNLELLYSEFAELGTFKDAPQICVEIREEIELIKKQIDDLEEERNQTVKQMGTGIGVIALSQRIQQIDAEIESKKKRV